MEDDVYKVCSGVNNKKLLVILKRVGWGLVNWEGNTIWGSGDDIVVICFNWFFRNCLDFCSFWSNFI